MFTKKNTIYRTPKSKPTPRLNTPQSCQEDMSGVKTRDGMNPQKRVAAYPAVLWFPAQTLYFPTALWDKPSMPLLGDHVLEDS